MSNKPQFEFIKGGGGGDGGDGMSPMAKKIRGLLVTVVGIFILLSVVYTSLVTYVRPYEVAIKESRYGKGLMEKHYFGPGLFITGPGVSYHRFPTTLQSLTMTNNPMDSRSLPRDNRSVGSLEIDSSDGSKIRIDATVLYRVEDPYLVLTKAGKGRLFEDAVIVPKSQEALKESLGKLKAEDFYDVSKRVAATNEATALLNANIEPFGLSADHVLIRQYYYEDKYQTQIEERKVEDQLVFTNEAKASAATMEAQRQKLDAEGKAASDLELKRGEAEVLKIRAEADSYSRKRRAAGDLLVNLALADGKKLENEAYRSSRGSDYLVGLEMAEVLEGIEVIFIQGGEGGTNVLDLNQTLNMFDVGE